MPISIVTRKNSLNLVFTLYTDININQLLHDKSPSYNNNININTYFIYKITDTNHFWQIYQF